MLPTYPIFLVCPRSLPSHWQNVLFWNFRSVSDELCFWWNVSDCYCLQSIYICLYLPDPYRNQTGWTCSSLMLCTPFWTRFCTDASYAETRYCSPPQWLLKNKRCFSINIRSFLYFFPIMCHARVSVYKRKSNFVFFVEMTAFLLNKRIENGECHF